MNNEDEPKLIDLLRQKQSDGIVAILCETVEDILTVEQWLASNPLDDHANVSVYNPKEPHFSKHEIISNFIESLRNCDAKNERTGKSIIYLNCS